ncbi:MAG: FCD domain-containing protein [Candidatus Thiodiazotropha endolucinida]|nr:FCD domain-containing protein [Candidatus Thiodiazotropha sp. (ex Lucina pensylvanica)]MCG7876533.1 FCD domain-containing protein [Candidatus Thiodiazotropha taylori]MCG8024233.1 FCD domain-containing protein [Candidatus Thiodiazotropha endolucinida]MCG7885790.1 FCD domain-containing protein [Candidatus Thiodiazotropha taylori]MCG7950870.1 FCD domain-containing protein [Candidatus Thiodiazotropha taylori]
MAITYNEQAEPNGAKTLSDQAYLQLRSDIIHGELQPDEKLRIEHLRTAYGVGASPLREALSRLTADGFVTAEGQRGFRVAPMSEEDLADITQLRILLEKQALCQSIEQGDDAWESRIVAAFYQLEKVEESEERDPAEWEIRNHDFHEALIAGCSSKWLRRFYGILYDQHKRYRNIALSTEIPRDLHQEHKALRNAALARDGKRACDAIEQHIMRTAEITLKVLREEAHREQEIA